MAEQQECSGMGKVRPNVYVVGGFSAKTKCKVNLMARRAVSGAYAKKESSGQDDQS
jgi:hypothetical protein